jgi:hypothetical protein
MADEPYWLGRASAEQQRLAKQHFIWTKYNAIRFGSHCQLSDITLGALVTSFTHPSPVSFPKMLVSRTSGAERESG